MANLTAAGVRARHAARGTAARGAGGSRTQRARADRPGRARRAAGAARRARPHAPLAPHALALPLAGRRRAAAGAARPARPRRQLRRRGRRRQLRARRRCRRSARPLAVRDSAPEPRLGARAARLRLAAAPRRGESGEDRRIARKLVGDWIKRSHGPLELAWEPEIVGRRVLSWLSHAALLLDGAEPKRYAAVMRSLTDQITYLSTSWRDAPDGCPRLVALIGLVHADLCIAGHDRRLAQSQKLLAAELERQVPPDGGHISRNPWALVELLLDLLPLRRCFAARAKTPDAGAARGHPADDGDAASPSPRRRHAGALQRHGARRARRARHRARLRRRPAGGTTPCRRAAATCGWSAAPRSSLIDAGPPPPMELAGAACAGCLSFELSSGTELVLVNGGVPGEIEAEPAHRCPRHAEPQHALPGRAVLGQARARCPPGAGDRRPASAPSRPRHVRRARGGRRRSRSRPPTTATSRAGASCTRARSKLDAAGTRLEGSDRLGPAKGLLRFSWDVPFADPLPSASGRRGARRALAGDGRAGARERRALAPDRDGGGRIDRGRPLLRRRRRRVLRASRSCCGHAAMASRRCPG